MDTENEYKTANTEMYGKKRVTELTWVCQCIYLKNYMLGCAGNSHGNMQIFIHFSFIPIISNEYSEFNWRRFA